MTECIDQIRDLNTVFDSVRVKPNTSKASLVFLKVQEIKESGHEVSFPRKIVVEKKSFWFTSPLFVLLRRLFFKWKQKWSKDSHYEYDAAISQLSQVLQTAVQPGGSWLNETNIRIVGKGLRHYCDLVTSVSARRALKEKFELSSELWKPFEHINDSFPEEAREIIQEKKTAILSEKDLEKRESLFIDLLHWMKEYSDRNEQEEVLENLLQHPNENIGRIVSELIVYQDGIIARAMNYGEEIPVESLFTPLEKTKAFKSLSEEAVKAFSVMKQNALLKDGDERMRAVYGIVSWLFQPKRVIPKSQEVLKKPSELAAEIVRMRKMDQASTEKSLLHTSALAMTDKQFGHVLGDAFLSETGLEGLPAGQAISLMQEMIGKYPEGSSPTMKSFLEKITSSVEMQDKTLEEVQGCIRGKVKALKQGESFIISGGWCSAEGGGGGHALYYEIIKTSAKKYSVRIYNTGAGLSYHPSLVENGQTKYLLFCDRTDVSEQGLLGSSFIEGIHCLSTKRPVEAYSEKDVYESVFAVLDGHFETRELGDEKKYSIPQMSGTCSWTALMAMAKMRLSEKEFLHFRYFVGWQSLAGFFQSNEKSFSQKAQNRRLLLLCSEQFARDCSEARSKGGIDEQSFEAGLATVQEIQTKLQAMEREEFLRKYQSRQDLSEIERPQSPPFGQLQLPSARSVQAAEVEKRTPLEVADIVPDQWRPETCAQQLEKFYGDCRGKRGDVAVAMMTSLFTALPMPGDGFWSQIPQEQLQQCLASLTNITELFLCHIAQAGVSQALYRNLGAFASLKGMVIQYQLLSRVPGIPKFSINKRHFVQAFTGIEFASSEVCTATQPSCSGFFSLQQKSQICQLLLHPCFVEEEKKPVLSFSKDGSPDLGTQILGSQRTGWDGLVSQMATFPKGKDHVAAVAACLSNPNESVLPPEFLSWYRQSLVAAYVTQHETRLKDIPEVDRHGGSAFTFSISLRKDYFLDSLYRWSVTANARREQEEQALLPKTPLQAVIEYTTHQKSMQGALFSDDVSEEVKKLLALDEWRDVAALFTVESTELRLAKLLAFFSKKPDRFKDPGYQNIFLQYMAIPGLLEDAFHLSDDLKCRFEEFVKSRTDEAALNRDIMSLCACNRIAYYGAAALHAVGKKPCTYMPLKDLLLQCSTDDERAIVYREMAFRIINDSSGEESLRELFQAKLFLALHKPPEDLALDAVIDVGSMAIAAKMKQYAAEHAIEMQKMVSDIYGQGLVNVSAFPLWTCGMYSIDVISGVSFEYGKKIGTLPLFITRDEEFSAVFPQAQYQASVSASGSEYVFNGGQARVLLSQDTSIRVQRLIDGVWYEHIHKNRLPKNFFDGKSPIGSCYLAETMSFWVSEDGAIVLLDKEQKPHYRITQGVNASVTRISDGSELENISSNPFPPFDAIEDRSYIHVWQKGGNIQQIDLPRYEMTCVMKNGRAYLDTPQGFYIADRQRLRGMGMFHNFLVIENDEGVRKVLMPRRQIALSQQSEKESFSLASEISMGVRPTSKVKGAPQFFLYDVDTTGSCVSPGREENLYLAYLFLGEKKYAESMEQLRKYAGDVKGFSAQEKELFHWIISLIKDGKDKNPQACAVHLCAAACFIKNSRQFSWRDPETVKSLNDLLVDQYRRYLQVIGHATTVVLNESEERELLIFLKSDLPELKQRLALITGTLCKEETVVETYHDKDIEKVPVPLFYEAGAGYAWGRVDTVDSVTNWVHPGTMLSNKFMTAYRSVRSTTDPKLLPRLRLAIHDPISGDLARLLLCVSLNPEKFPEEINDLEELQRLWPTMLETAREIEKKSEVSVVHHIAEVVEGKPFPVHVELKKLAVKPAPAPSTEGPSGVPDLLEAPDLTSPVHSQQFAALQEDCTKVVVPQQKQYTYRAQKLPAYKLRRAELQKQIYQRESELLALANQMPQDPSEARQRAMQLASTEKRPITMRDLTVFFLQQNGAVLLENNPSVAKDLDKINVAVLAYFQLCTQLQQLDRALKLAEKLEKEALSEEVRQRYIKELATELGKERAYNPAEHPEYLVYEYSANILIRKDQVEILNKMGKEGAPECIYQMIMGSGKSKVLLPILALKKATGKNLSIVVVPDPLAETEARDMQISVGQAFYQNTTVLRIDRQSDFSAEAMKALYDELERIKKNRGCLIMTSKTVGCLTLQFESELRAWKGETIPEHLEWMRKSIHLLKTEGDAIFDEADVLLNNRKELNFAIGTPQSLPERRLDCVAYLYEARLDGIVEKTALARRMLDRLQLEPKYLPYVLGEGQSIEESDGETKELLGLLKGELETLLPLTLGKACDTAYGFSKTSNKPIAIPYEGNNAPVETSDFGTPYEMLNFTMQTYLNKRPIPPHIIRPMIEDLQERLKKEHAVNPHVLITELPAYKDLRGIFGEDPFFPFDTLLYEGVIKKLEENQKTCIAFVRKYVFPQVMIHPQKLSMTAPGLVEAFHSVQGFTGTPWNSSTYPSRLRTEKVAGTDGKTVKLLWTHSKDAIRPLQHEGFSGASGEVVALIRAQPECQAFIDAGALFRGADNETVARYLLEKLPEYKGIVFYRGNTMMVLEHGRVVRFAESTLLPKERFTYYDQLHTTGSDIEQSPKAHAVVSVSPTLSWRDFAQAVWRMRGLDKEQRISVVTPPSMKGVQDMGQLIHALCEVQFTTLDEHQLVAATQKANEVLKQHVLDEVTMAELTPETVRAARLDILTTNTEDHPYQAFGSKTVEVNREEFIQQKKIEMDRKITTMRQDQREKCTQAVGQVLDHSSIQDTGIRVASLVAQTEVETEKQQEKEIQQEMQVERSVLEEPLKPFVYHALFEYKRKEKILLFDPVKQVAEVDGKEEAVSIQKINQLLAAQGSPQLFSDDLVASDCFYRTKASNGTVQLFSSGELPVQHLLVTQVDGKMRARFLSFREAQALLKVPESCKIAEKAPPSFLYDMQLGVIQHFGDVDPMVKSREFQSLRVQAKFFDGQVVYSQEELACLKEWFGPRRKQFLSFFQETILQFKKEKKRQFTGSDLEKVLTGTV